MTVRRNIFVYLVLIVFCNPIKVHPQTTDYGFYYVSGSGAHGIWLAEKDQQGNWKRGKKLFLNGQFDGNAVDPDVIKLNDGRYRIFYYKGFFVTQPPLNYKVHEIYSAVSIDGINFTIEGKAFESEGITDPTVTQLKDGSYLMACVLGTTIIFAKSSDGKVFQSNGSVLQNGGIPELAGLDDGSVRLFYNGPGGIVSSHSTDGGMNWIKESGTRLVYNKGIADPSVIKRADGKWYMFVKGFNNNGAQGPAGHNVMLSESDDCLTFNFVNGVLLDSASVPEGVVINHVSNIDEKRNDAFPDDFLLYQNYPNPFNPETVISYKLPVAGYVLLEVYDLLGRKTEKLVDKYQQPGAYSEKFQGLFLPAGIYFYNLSFNGVSISKKMVLLK